MPGTALSPCLQTSSEIVPRKVSRKCLDPRRAVSDRVLPLLLRRLSRDDHEAFERKYFICLGIRGVSLAQIEVVATQTKPRQHRSIGVQFVLFDELHRVSATDPC